MKHSFFYDAYLVDKDTIQQVNNTDDNEGFREDDYDATQILLQTIIGKIQNLAIVEISQNCHKQNHISHFYRVLRKSSQAKFHISLINQRWYQDSKLNIDDKEIALLDVISIIEDHNSSAVVHEEINFNYIHHVRGEQVYTEKLQGIISAKSKYGKAFSFAKKALDLTQKLDCYNELNGLLQTYIEEKQQELLCNQTTDENTAGNQQENIECSNPVTSRRRGRPPGRYLSEGETLRQNKKQKKTEGNLEVNGNDKKERKCKGCGGTGHDLRNCKRRILSEKN
ncbi:hypothetical protein RhiirA4_539632 [Rhizophagus irregularis]|uniref:CCHC-type domain-containing protein n=1 Tax=Rhizophagus irregularis TaxID=588596 RepID=A0A2I1G4I8_9GLOM|nr:hypothetical protein RhiirA4_539632 [Rhizophagus irregularis]